MKGTFDLYIQCNSAKDCRLGQLDGELGVSEDDTLKIYSYVLYIYHKLPYVHLLYFRF